MSAKGEIRRTTVAEILRSDRAFHCPHPCTVQVFIDYDVNPDVGGPSFCPVCGGPAWRVV